MTTTDFGWTLDAQDLLLGMTSSDNGLAMASTADGTINGALTVAVVPGTSDETQDFIQLITDPLGGAFVLARSYSGGLELLHIQ